MFLGRARRPASLPALLFTSLLLVSGAAAQGQKTETARPPQSPGGVGAGTGIGPGDPAAGRQPPGPDGPFRQAEVTRKAVITFKPQPGFTEEARLNGVDGVVRLRAVLSASGEVSRISVLKGLPDGLTERAVAAARQIRFQPAQKDGRAVSQYVILEYNFNIYEDEDKVDRKAVILEKPEPEYTEEARAQQVKGTVVLELYLHKGGTLYVGETVKGLPHGLTEKAREAAKRIKFKPAEHKGRPVSVVSTVEYVFRLP